MEEKIMNTTEDVVMEVSKKQKGFKFKKGSTVYVLGGIAIGVGINAGAMLAKKAWVNIQNKKHEPEVVNSEDINEDEVVDAEVFNDEKN